MRYEAVYDMLKEEYERLRSYKFELEKEIKDVDGFVRKKKVNGKEYYYLCKSKRVGDKVVQVHLRPLSKEEAREIMKVKQLKRQLREVNIRLKYMERLLRYA
ncbi:hypothetical protein [Hydrogenivirga sp. 128-5-R1-1]|uniref:hypothetical protein n=1 Tax=Hydrogenivirga sp. 128-5-R1-1 TaxID=392423 RepID=UPI00015F39E6|nr:hypothetical protein [Hydrogenivirga sp. 128-5-R1-1]EDP75101.1 hypothetical protein HG1285_14574 [Hydrogenivirga sp. 128-5-R1-1]